MDAPALEARRAHAAASGRSRPCAGSRSRCARGELYGLVGPDGAGKTTAIRVLAGLIDARRGDGAGAGPRLGARAAAPVREALGLMPQQYSLYRDLSVGENLRFFGRLYCLPAQALPRAQRRGCCTSPGSRPSSTAAPTRSRAACTRSSRSPARCCTSPRCCCSTSRPTASTRSAGASCGSCSTSSCTSGMAVLLSTPYMDEAERCHRVGLIHHGRLLLEGEPAGAAA